MIQNLTINAFPLPEIYALIITLVVEEVILLILREKNIKVFILCFFLNILTNPMMNLGLGLVSNYYYLWLGLAEVIVFIIEALIYYLLTNDFKRSIVISLACNLGSLIIGLLIFLII